VKASVVTQIGAPFTVMDVTLAKPEAREVVVEVRASGLCRSDHTIATMDVGIPLPSVLGHEVAGVVTAVGSRVSDVAVGDHVVGCLIQFCGRCERCVDGKNFQCRYPEATLRPSNTAPRLSRPGLVLNQGFGLGGFAEQVLVHENQLTKVPAEIPFPQAAVIGCGVVTGAGAVLNSASVRQGETVVILGAGGVGLNGIQGAALAGASRIVATDIDDGKLRRAKDFGATDLVNAGEIDPVEAVKELLPHGADHVFDFVGARPVTAQGLEMVGVGGGLYLIGADSATPGVDIDGRSLMYRHARVQGVGMGSTNPRRDIPMYAGLYLQDRLRLDELVTKTIALSEINQGYAAMSDGSAARVVVTTFD
jgi:S-(hydroxymethyl)glutathione dehydrogenase/alcohol dehydrogenase